MTTAAETGRPMDPMHALAIDCLSGGMTITATAEAVGVTRQTVGMWARNPAHPVGRSLEELRAGVVERARGKLREIADDAVDVLREVMMDREAPPAARIAAVREVLSRAGVVETTRSEVTVEGGDYLDRLTDALRRHDADDIDRALGVGDDQ